MAALLLTFLGKLLLSDHGCMGEGYRREARKWGFSDTDELLPREQLTVVNWLLHAEIKIPEGGG